MTLSYTLRLLCVLLVVAGLVQTATHITLAVGARSMLSCLERASARRRERILYRLLIGPAILAAFVAFAICLPAYLRHEPNREIENVSLVCVLLAAGQGLWFALAVLRGLRITLRTLRFTQICRRSG